MPEIDFFDALQRGLQKIASEEPCSSTTGQLTRSAQRSSRVRTEPVQEVDISLTEFVSMTTPSTTQGGDTQPGLTAEACDRPAKLMD
ncbi:hypothetical protein [Acidovorax sp. Leaf160]|uniref:hypothetical protein n=1 Tax=Acidovorax sp. Leaf160 TaxID=1736280 RepID=UPI0012E3EF7E|nr:hypothetical protein [Acidovorax sp. Leaf160]